MPEKQLNEQQLQALLRLKRFEQPPPGYFDDLLANVHRRQQEEFLRAPAWRLAMDRVKTFFQSLKVDWAYAGSMAALLMLGVAVIQMALPRKEVVPTWTASTTSTASAVAAPNPSANVVVVNSPNGPRMLSLQPQAGPMLTSDSKIVPVPTPGAGRQPQQGPPRYIIDARPVSYEQTQIHF